MQQRRTGFWPSVLCFTAVNWTKSDIRLNIANGVIWDTVTGFSKAFYLPLFSKYYNVSRYSRECNFIHNGMKGTSFLSSNVVIVKIGSKVMFRSLMSNFVHVAQEMWEVFFEL